jgi:hypothetical protein
VVGDGTGVVVAVCPNTPEWAATIIITNPATTDMIVVFSMYFTSFPQKELPINGLEKHCKNFMQVLCKKMDKIV